MEHPNEALLAQLAVAREALDVADSLDITLSSIDVRRYGAVVVAPMDGGDGERLAFALDGDSTPEHKPGRGWSAWRGSRSGVPVTVVGNTPVVSS